MVDIYRVIRQNLNKYIETLRAQVGKEEAALKKDGMDRRFLLNLCVFINTIDYMKETISKMTDVIVGLIDEPYNQNLDFSDEEDLCSRVCIEIINAMMRLYETKLDTILLNNMLKIAWDKLENVILVSSYINDLKLLTNFFADAIKENISNVYVIRTLKCISEITNNRFVDAIFKIKKINDFSVQQLHIGKLNRLRRDQAAVVQPRVDALWGTHIECLQ